MARRVVGIAANGGSTDVAANGGSTDVPANGGSPGVAGLFTAGSDGRRRTRATDTPRRWPPRTSARAASRPAIASSMARCDASGSCQPVSIPSTDVTGCSAVTTVSVHPRAGVDLVSRVHHRLEGAHDGGADGDDPAPLAPRVVDAMGRGPRHPVVLGIGRLGRLERRHAGVQHDRGDADPPGHEPGEDLGGEGPCPHWASRPSPARWRRRSGTSRWASFPGRIRSGWDGRAPPGRCAGARAWSRVADPQPHPSGDAAA